LRHNDDSQEKQAESSYMTKKNLNEARLESNFMSLLVDYEENKASISKPSQKAHNISHFQKRRLGNGSFKKGMISSVSWQVVSYDKWSI